MSEKTFYILLVNMLLFTPSCIHSVFCSHVFYFILFLLKIQLLRSSVFLSCLNLTKSCDTGLCHRTVAAAYQYINKQYLGAQQTLTEYQVNNTLFFLNSDLRLRNLNFTVGIFLKCKYNESICKTL